MARVRVGDSSASSRPGHTWPTRVTLTSSDQSQVASSTAIAARAASTWSSSAIRCKVPAASKSMRMWAPSSSRPSVTRDGHGAAWLSSVWASRSSIRSAVRVHTDPSAASSTASGWSGAAWDSSRSIRSSSTRAASRGGSGCPQWWHHAPIARSAWSRQVIVRVSVAPVLRSAISAVWASGLGRVMALPRGWRVNRVR